MIELKRLKLINWHNFENVTFDCARLTYMIGVNAVGKTTILDAIRYCLTTNRNFNALGNKKSGRTLQGSVHAKQRGENAYRRPGHTVAYIGAEFYDSLKRAPFVIAVRVESEGPMQELHPGDQTWYLSEDGCTLEQLPFIDPKTGAPSAKEDFKPATGRLSYTRSPSEARDRICRALGIGRASSPLGKKFNEVFQMGTSMDEIPNFREFLYQYILPQPELDLDALQGDRLELENLHAVLAEAQTRADALEEIVDFGREAAEKQTQTLVNRGAALLARAAADGSEQTVWQEHLDAGRRQLEQLNARYAEAKNAEAEARRAYLSAHGAASASGEGRALDALTEELSRRKTALDTAARKAEKAESALARTQSLLAVLRRSGFAAGIKAEELTADTLPQLTAWLSAQEKPLEEAYFAARQNTAALQKEQAGKRAELDAVSGGKWVYPHGDAATRVRDAVNAELKSRGMQPDAKIFCELLNVEDESWQDCVEACLGDRRFDILVPPAHYEAAKSAFVALKDKVGPISRDMSCAAARYTEAKLEGVCEELFRDIDKETVDFVPNYDGTTTEPTLLPVTFPTILANNTLGIAVGMACNICSFNLAELCDTTVALMKDAKHDISTTMPAPDFVGGGQILYDEAQMRDIFENGRGSVKVRARYAAVPGENMIEITQIPPTTTVEAIMDKIAELVKAGKIKEISDMRDETDLNGLKLTLDLKRGVDADKLMAKLFKTTPLEDSFSCNFNILVSGQPRVMGVREILQEWTAFRMECVRRRTWYDLHGKEKRLHLLKGLAAILMDIDKAIHIIRTTEEETEVVPNLMIGFGIDEVQADYVAEIKLRHLNREYILKRTGEIEQLEADIADLNDILAKPARIRKIIMKELADVAKKYGQPRRSEILYDLPEEESGAEEEVVPDYPVTVFFTREGYLKKIPPQSLRTAGAHKLKEGDEIVQQVETRNNVEALFFTDKQQVYKVRLAELEDGKVAQMGIYLPGRLGMDEGENILSMVITSDYSGHMLFFFASGKCAKIPLSSYATKQNRRKLLKAYCDKEPLATMFFLPEETELAIRTSAGRMLLVGTAQIAAKTTRDSQGVAVVTLKKNQTIASVVPADTLELANPHRYRVRSLPATGALIRAEDEGEQMTLL